MEALQKAGYSRQTPSPAICKGQRKEPARGCIKGCQRGSDEAEAEARITTFPTVLPQTYCVDQSCSSRLRCVHVGEDCGSFEHYYHTAVLPSPGRCY